MTGLCLSRETGKVRRLGLLRISRGDFAVVAPFAAVGAGRIGAMVDVSTAHGMVLEAKGRGILLISPANFGHRGNITNVGFKVVSSHGNGSDHTLQAGIHFPSKGERWESSGWIERSFSYHVGRKFLPGKQFTTGDSTTGDHQRLPLQGFEGVAADEHVDTIILGIKGETVLLLQVSGPNLMQGENCELFHSLISS